MNWLSTHLPTLTLTESHEGYFLGRGASEESIIQHGVTSWANLPEPCSDPEFADRYGEHGERLEDFAVWPLFSPRGDLIAIEGRPIPAYGLRKAERYLLTEAEWQPIWFGLTPETMERIWNGCDVWIVEGLFDLFALEWAIPKGDVVLASLRAKLTDKHVEFLRRFCKGWVKMVYDNDEAGRNGVHDWIDDNGKKRWGALHRLERVEVKAMSVPYRGKDPGEIWNQGGIAGIRATFS